MDAHEREYAAAAAGMAENAGYLPQRGDVVEVERPFHADRVAGVVMRVWGTAVEVSINGETVLYQQSELRPVARQVNDTRSAGGAG